MDGVAIINPLAKEAVHTSTMNVIRERMAASAQRVSGRGFTALSAGKEVTVMDLGYNLSELGTPPDLPPQWKEDSPMDIAFWVVVSLRTRYTPPLKQQAPRQQSPRPNPLHLDPNQNRCASGTLLPLCVPPPSPISPPIRP